MIALLAAQAAVAATPSFCPKTGGKVDPSVAADKEEIAGAALDRAGVSRPLERRLSHVALRPGLTLWQTLVARGSKLCKSQDAGSDAGAIDCSEDERNALDGAVIAFGGFLKQTDQLLVTAPDPDAEAFFRDSDRSIRCKADPASSTAAPAGADAGKGTGDATAPAKSTKPLWDLANVRVRGSSADLIYPRGSSGFASADKAQLNFGNDSVKGKRSTKFVAALGYALPFVDRRTASGGHLSLDVVPYGAIDIDTSKSTGKPVSVSSNTLEFGSVVEFREATASPTTYAPFVSYVSATPKFLFNRDDRSRVAGIDLLYRPSFSVVNALTPLGGSDIYWNIIADVRWNNGTFVRQGTRAASDSRDFSRVGGRLGIGFATLGATIPAELTVTDIYLIGIAGEPRHLSLFKSDLSIYFNPKKYFGVDFGYSRGRDQDLDSRVQQWTIGFAVKY